MNHSHICIRLSGSSSERWCSSCSLYVLILYFSFVRTSWMVLLWTLVSSDLRHKKYFRTDIRRCDRIFTKLLGSTRTTWSWLISDHCRFPWTCLTIQYMIFLNVPKNFFDDHIFHVFDEKWKSNRKLLSCFGFSIVMFRCKHSVPYLGHHAVYW